LAIHVALLAEEGGILDLHEKELRSL
jgi:hypothetical protein